ncbi:MAG: hypothetical protein MJ103_03275 [Saccharofermentans sp.]|nr:hypothetical protein [Saccharofermentans sp.]
MIAQIRTLLYRVVRSKSTWILLIAPALILTLGFLLRLFEISMAGYENAIIPFYPAEYAILLFFASAVFTHIIVSTEKSDGGWRNKISIGVKRIYIYMASWIVSALFALLSTSLFVLTDYILRTIWGNSHTKNYIAPENKFIVLTLVWVLAFSALYTLINVYFSMKIFGLVVSLLAFWGFIGIRSLCQARLDEPYKKFFVNEETGLEEYEENPYYVTGNVRKALVYISERVPIVYNDMTDDTSDRKISKHVDKIQKETAIVFLLTSTVIGIVSFERKEIT